MDLNQLKYATTHEWSLVDGDIWTVGITQFAVDQLTDIVYIELPSVGKKVKVGEPFGVIESVKAVSDLYAPVSGEVVDSNKAVADDPAKLSDDAFDKGWMIKIKVAGAPDAKNLKDKKQYDEQIASEGHH